LRQTVGYVDSTRYYLKQTVEKTIIIWKYLYL